ncbi:HpcH/HpaI aldolase family protein [Ideonella sp. BN130291]|uniref:HpcH/HpaI aldolase family protein n=1 Tax=Ideonella sp. BN130291 TaxID=3112940 RepID=UPI002E25B365|nr:HpcH/HpaI aldolase/citrate lyase family protein [Ideonella sp. BN130291]
MNAFRQLMKSAGSHPPIGTWVMSASSLVAEAVGHAGFDWVLVDMEHTPADMMEIVHMLQALAATKAVPVVRVPWNDSVMVKRVLDAGAATVMFPFVQSADEARRAVAATRYPPQGVRGMAGMSRASRYGTTPNYLKTANAEAGVIVQLETREAVQALEAIAQVDGVDALFIGPADLSASLGHVGEPAHPEVLDLMSQAAGRARAAGKPIGTLGGTPEMVAQYRAAGFDYVALSSDLGLLMRGAQTALASLRTQEVGAHVHTLNTGTRTAGGH